MLQDLIDGVEASDAQAGTQHPPTRPTRIADFRTFDPLKQLFKMKGIVPTDYAATNQLHQLSSCANNTNTLFIPATQDFKNHTPTYCCPLMQREKHEVWHQVTSLITMSRRPSVRYRLTPLQLLPFGTCCRRPTVRYKDSMLHQQLCSTILCRRPAVRYRLSSLQLQSFGSRCRRPTVRYRMDVETFD